MLFCPGRWLKIMCPRYETAKLNESFFTIIQNNEKYKVIVKLEQAFQPYCGILLSIKYGTFKKTPQRKHVSFLLLTKCSFSASQMSYICHTRNSILLSPLL